MSDFGSSSTQVPDGFICPISLEVMRDPVMNRKGQSYDRKSILLWLHKGNDRCPLTREPLRPSQLVPNNALKTQIRRWSMEHGVSHELDEQQFSHIEELGVIGFMENNHDDESESQTNPLADLSDLFDQVLEITSSD